MQGFLIIAPIVLLMSIGATLRHTNFLTESDVNCMAKLVYWLVSPAILFRAALHLEMNWASQANYAAAVYLSALLTAVSVFLFGKYVLRNQGGLILPISVLASFRSNSMMVGIPLIMLALGEAGTTAVAVYFAVTEAGYNLLSIFGAELSRGAGEDLARMSMKALKGVATSPLFLASVSGLLLSSIGFHRLPHAVDTVFVLIANMATGLSVLMIGASLKLSSIRSNAGKLLPDCLVRLLIHPALMMVCFYLFPVQADVMRATVIMTASPAPNIAFVFAQGMGLDSEYAAGLIGLTTILFVVTMPIWLSVLKIA